MRFYLFTSFMFVVILWHSCCSDCNPYDMQQGNTPETIYADTADMYYNTLPQRIKAKSDSLDNYNCP